MTVSAEDHPLSQEVEISPTTWPDAHDGVRPGDFSQYVNKGVALAVPLVVRPWDSLEDAARRPDYYGGEAPVADPIRNAPVNTAEGGCVYLDRGFDQAALDTLLALMGVYVGTRDYSVFYANAADVIEERFLHQLRIVCRSGLRSLFRIQKETIEPLEDQRKNVGELLWAFIEREREMWGRGYSPQLDGRLGGDGDFAREALAFGLLVENQYHGVYRIWSRPWLVTK